MGEALPVYDICARSELIEARRAVAIAKIVEFDFQCRRLAKLARLGFVDGSLVADELQQISEAHNFPETFGIDYVQRIMADAFGERAT